MFSQFSRTESTMRVESLPVKKKKGKKGRASRETEFVVVGKQSDSDGDGVRVHAVAQDGVDDYDEVSLSTKKKEDTKSHRNRDRASEGLHGNSNVEAVREQVVTQDGVKNFVMQSLPTNMKKRKKSGRDRGVEGSRNIINSDYDRLTDQAIVGNNESGLGESPMRKKKAKKSGRVKETEHGGHLVTIDSENDRVQNRVVSHSGVVESDVQLFSLKKVKKTVRFQEPEIHWREEEEDEEHQEEKNGEWGDYELEDEDNSSIVCDEEVFSNGVFTLERTWKNDLQRMDLKYGFFTKEEDEKLKTTVYDFIKAKKWGEEEGLEMLLHSRSHAETKGAWIEIAKCLPHRSVKLINSRAHRLLSPLKRGTWSQEELEKLKELQTQHGHNWKAIERGMGRRGQLCKDKWRVLRLAPFRKIGKWSEEELDQLCVYVRWSLKLKEQYGKKEKDRRILRDDINWETIAEKMGRTSAGCSVVWYERLASSLIAEGNWANGDDRRLLRSLMESGASSEEAVDWDELLDDRDGLTCEKRWYQMLRLLAERGQPFEDKLEQLIKRYAPDLIGIEEDFVTATAVVQ